MAGGVHAVGRRGVLGPGAGGIKDEKALHALRILRSFVRGFVLHEVGASFLEPLEHDQTYELGVRVFIEGLQVLRT
jgi:hypothetical protein